MREQPFSTLSLNYAQSEVNPKLGEEFNAGLSPREEEDNRITHRTNTEASNRSHLDLQATDKEKPLGDDKKSLIDERN